MNLTVPKLIGALPFTWKSSLDLRSYLRCTIDKNMQFYKFKVVFRSTCRRGNFFNMKYSLEKKSTLNLSTAIHVVTAKLLITEKRFHHFFLEHENTLEL